MDGWFILPVAPFRLSSTPPTPHVRPPVLLALTPHIALSVALLSAVAWIGWVHVRAARRRRHRERYGDAHARQDGENEPLLNATEDATSRRDAAASTHEGQFPTGWELLLEVLKVLTAVVALALTVVRLVGLAEGKWERVLDGGVVGLTAYLPLTSAAKIADSRVEELVRLQQVFLSLVLVFTNLGVSVYPFVFVSHPPLTLYWRIGIAQTALSFLLCTLLLMTPPRWTPRLAGVPPNPAQTASPLSRLFFSFLELRMMRYYFLSSPRLAKLFRVSSPPDTDVDSTFKSFVPPLPDVLHSEYILNRFRWEGDAPRDDFDQPEKEGRRGGEDEAGHDSAGPEEEEEEKKVEMGTARQFAWRHRWDLAVVLAFASGWIVFIFVSPLSMNLLLRYVQSSQDPPYGLSPYLFVTAIFVAPIASSVCYQSALYRLAQLGLRLRALLGHAIYAKLLRIKAGGGGDKEDGEEEDGEEGGEANGKANGDGKKKGKKAGGGGGGGNEAVGRVNNLVGTDVDTITSSLPPALQLFGVLPKLVVSLIFLYFLLGWSSFVALGVIVAFAPISKTVASKYGGVQGEIMKATDKRITLVQELLNSIRILKMFGWEKPSMKRIGEARELELGRITKRAKVYAGMMFLSTGIPAIVTLSTFGAFVFLQKQTLTASTAFTAMSLFGLLREAVISATYLLSAFMRARVSLDRISHFIADTEELDSKARTFNLQSASASSSSGKSSSSSSSTKTDDAAIVVSADSQFRFSRYGAGGFTLSTSLPSGGNKSQASGNGNGKDSGELHFPRGKTSLIAGDVGSGKSAMLLALLGEMHVKQGGVEFRTGNDGSGEVKVSYAAQAPWLQDTSIRNNILFGEEYDEERYNETIFACSLEDDLETLPEGDETRVGEKGLSLSGGQKQRVALARAVYARSEIVLLDDVLSALDSNMVSAVVENCLNGPLLEGRTVVLVTHFVKLCARRLNNLELVVQLRNGKIKSAGPPSSELTVGGSGFTRSPSQSSMNSNRSNRSHRSGSSRRMHQAHVKHGSGQEETHRGDSSGEGSEISWRIYRHYARAMGGWKFWVPYAVVNVVAHVFMLAQGWFVGRWVNAPDRSSHAGRYFAVYAGIQIIASVSLTAMYLALIWGAIRASRILHDRLTRRIFAAPFRWWDRTPLGNVTNRFSKDTEILDTEQVEAMQPVLDYLPQIVFVGIVISAVLPIFLLPAAVIALIFFFIGNLYVRNALAARKEVANSRSPLFSTLGDTTSGVTTIRAFARQEHFAARYKTQTDEYNKAQLYEEGLNRWLEERTDAMGAVVSFIVGLLCLSSGLSSGVTGFLISTGLEFTSRILYVVRAINKNELSLNSVQRILQYSTEVETEEPPTDKKAPPAHWPDKGEIEFEGFSAKYTENGEDVLHDLSLSIKPGEKIGIVGPSGCGKSSLSLALLRFILTSSGSITVDGRALSDTNLDALRSRFTLVPQDPTLFSGTLRSNLDPEGAHDDETLWSAVTRSGFVRGGEGEGEDSDVTLDTPVASGGSNFSQGQRQLVGLARALVRGSKVIILDEATASLDNESDALVQRVIREEFVGATNLTVAHRLESIIDYDRVLVLRSGRVVEFDTPLALLDKRGSDGEEGGAFAEMVEATGSWDELYEKAKAAADRGQGGKGKK
ncbi:hypothetical protein JCM10207_008238 [Rhodosporidiobolus poonsookiae]